MSEVLSFYTNKKKVLISESDFELLLRRVVRADISKIMQWMENRELVRYSFGAKMFSDYDHDFAVNNYLQLISNPKSPCHFLAVCRPDSEIIGLAKYDLRYMQGVGKIALSGLMMGSEGSRGRGVGTRAMALMNRFLFEQEEVDLIELETADYNLRAQHCFKRVGLEECQKLYSLEGITGYGLGENDAPKVFMRLTKERYFHELAPLKGILPKYNNEELSQMTDSQAP
ncbi:MAG: GNAT family N-acetyltransferase [Candidatus Bruticola sp.]